MFGDHVGEFWEPGYFHTGSSYMEVMRVLEDLESAGNGVRLSQPTSGYTRYIGHVQVTALTPAISLRSRFDTFGVEINNSSIAMRLEFPASRVVQQPGSRDFVRTKTQRILLGADAQTVSWAHALTDFPDLHTERSAAAKALRVALGTDPLKANVFKVPHHMSKHGLNLELVEQVSPALSLVRRWRAVGSTTSRTRCRRTPCARRCRPPVQATSSGRPTTSSASTTRARETTQANRSAQSRSSCHLRASGRSGASATNRMTRSTSPPHGDGRSNRRVLRSPLCNGVAPGYDIAVASGRIVAAGRGLGAG